MNNGIIFACFVMVGAVFKEYLCIVNFLKMIFRSKICDIIFQVLLPIVLIGLFFITNLFHSGVDAKQHIAAKSAIDAHTTIIVFQL